MIWDNIQKYYHTYIEKSYEKLGGKGSIYNTYLYLKLKLDKKNYEQIIYRKGSI